MTVVASWRTALRVARREARRSRGRSALVVIMIGLPVLALSFAAVSYDMFTLTGDERADQTMGATDARMSWEFRAPIEQFPDGENFQPVVIGAEGPRAVEQRTATEAELLAKLPAGSTVHSLGKGTVEMRTTDGLARPNAIAVDATAPSTLGYVEVLDGRAPRTATEVGLTKQAMKRLGQRIGGTVTSGDGSRSYTVVGEVEFPSLLEEVVLFAPVTEIRTALGLQQQWLVDTPAPVTWAQVRELNQSGIVVASRDVFVHPPPADEVPAFAGAGSAVSTGAHGGRAHRRPGAAGDRAAGRPGVRGECPTPPASTGARGRERRHAGTCPPDRPGRRRRARPGRRGCRPDGRRRGGVRGPPVRRGVPRPRPSRRLSRVSVGAGGHRAARPGHRAAGRARAGVHHRSAERRRIAGRASGRHEVAQALDRRRHRDGRSRHRAGRSPARSQSRRR